MIGDRFRIGVDARAFVSPAGGVRRYVWELYGALQHAAPDVEVVAVGARHGDALPAHVLSRRARAWPTNLGWMAVSLPLAARGARLDVFHAPAYTAPLWGVHPQALTIHDVSYERRPEWNAYRDDRARRWFYRKAALAADAVITDSDFSKREIAAAYGIPADGITVVPLAASAAFTPGPYDAAIAPATVERPYVLHVGDLHVRRNLTTALDAVLALRRTPGRDAARPALVCAGIDRGIGAALRARASADPGALVLTGAVGEAALVNLYRGASGLVYPSMYEGFGLPLLEAMQCGIPVIASNCASIPEVTGDAAILVDPLDVPAWQHAIDEVTRDQTTAARLADAGVRRAARFTWSRTAAETLAVLRRCAEGARR